MMRTNSIASLAAIIALAATAACTTNVAFDDDGGGAGGSGASGGTGGTGGTCSVYDDQTSPSTVTVTVRNDTGMTIYLPTSCGQLMPNIEPSAGFDGTSYTYDDSCLSTCEDLQTGEPIACTAEACALTSIAIAHGATYQLEWDGTGLKNTEMPAACWNTADYGPNCSQIVTAPGGDYSVGLQAFDSCEGDCACDGGVCWGSAVGNEGLHDNAGFSFPEDGSVEILFGACAFGCADN
jgi:hypothetical protein